MWMSSKAKSFWYWVKIPSIHNVKLVWEFHKFYLRTNFWWPVVLCDSHNSIWGIFKRTLKFSFHLPIVSTKHIQGIIPRNKSMFAASGNEKDGAKNTIMFPNDMLLKIQFAMIFSPLWSSQRKQTSDCPLPYESRTVAIWPSYSYDLTKQARLG